MGVLLKLALALAFSPAALAGGEVAPPEGASKEMKYNFVVPTEITELEMTKLGLPALITDQLRVVNAMLQTVWCEKKAEEKEMKEQKKITSAIKANAIGSGKWGVWNVDATKCNHAFAMFQSANSITFTFEIGIFEGHVGAPQEGHKGDLSRLMFVGLDVGPEDDGKVFPIQSTQAQLGNGRKVQIKASVDNLEIYLEGASGDLTALKEDGDLFTTDAVEWPRLKMGNFDAVHRSRLKIGDFFYTLFMKLEKDDLYIKEVTRANADDKPQYTNIEGILIYTTCINFPRAASFDTLGKASGMSPWRLVRIALVLLVAAAAVAWCLGLIGGGGKAEKSEGLSSRLSSVEGEIEVEASS